MSQLPAFTAQPIETSPLAHWHRWRLGRGVAEVLEGALQHFALCDPHLQPHLYRAALLAWEDAGPELLLPPEMMPAKGQAAAYLAFWDREDRQLRLEGTVQPLETPARGGRVRLELRRVEFWQGAAFRLHDRVVYHAEGGMWRAERLYP